MEIGGEGAEDEGGAVDARRREGTVRKVAASKRAEEKARERERERDWRLSL